MIRSKSSSGRTSRRADALIGFAGAVLSATGDVLILGRRASGQEFDRAVGVIPSHVVPDPRWQSLWNGAALPPRRVHLGTWTGVFGIGLLQWVGMRGAARTLRPGGLRLFAEAAAAAFAVSGVLTHLCCAAVISAYRRAWETGVEPSVGRRPAPRSATTLLAVSAVGALSSLAALSCSMIVDALRRGPVPTMGTVATPFPCVLAALLTFGRLPAPVAGFVRPASMSVGLMVFFALAAATTEQAEPAPNDLVDIDLGTTTVSSRRSLTEVGRRWCPWLP